MEIGIVGLLVVILLVVLIIYFIRRTRPAGRSWAKLAAAQRRAGR